MVQLRAGDDGMYFIGSHEAKEFKNAYSKKLQEFGKGEDLYVFTNKKTKSKPTLDPIPVILFESGEYSVHLCTYYNSAHLCWQTEE